MAVETAGTILPIDMDSIDVGVLASATILSSDSSHIQEQVAPGYTADLYGTFSFDANGNLSGGTLTEISESYNGALWYDISGFSVAVSSFNQWIQTDDNFSAKSTILGGATTYTGTPFDDLFRAYGSNNTFMASGGNDQYYGGTGVSTVAFSSSIVNYSISSSGDSWLVVDNRSGSPDGANTLSSIQYLEFADVTVAIGATPSAATLQQVEAEFAAVLRQSVSDASQTPTQQLSDGTSVPNSVFVAAQLVLPYASQIDSGLASPATIATDLAHQAASTSSVATLAYEFFTGSAPSAAGMDYLVSPTGPNPNNLNSAYYQSFSLENRYINFAVNLGAVGAGEANFEAQYGALDLSDATTLAYTTIFGTAPTAAKVDTLLDTVVTSNGVTETRADYLAGYGGDGLTGLGTKAAMVGWLLAEAVKADVGDYALSNDAFLAAVASGTTSFGVDLIGQFDQPSFHYTGG